MAEDVVLTVLQRGASTVLDEATYLSEVSTKVSSAKEKLELMRSFLADVDDRMLKGGELDRHLVSKVREVAYEVEDIIDYANILTKQSDPKISITGAICKYTCFPMHLCHLHKLGTRIDQAISKMEAIFEDFDKRNIASASNQVMEDDTLHTRQLVHPDIDDEADVIGFDDQIQEIKNELLDEKNTDLTIISIVGPGGAGKSTLAKRVYGLRGGSFEACVWTSVSQRFVSLDLLKGIATGTMGFNKSRAEKLGDESEHEVKKMLHDFLQEKRYLIVLDDVWKTDVWNVVEGVFPEMRNGSRIILTTRNAEVAEFPKARKKIYMPKLLDGNESLELLYRKAFPPDSAESIDNLDEMKKVGEDLATKCGGLPLAIIVLGGYLSRKLNIIEWKRIARSIDWDEMRNEIDIIGILDLSYYDMPRHLRSCFMYATSFPEDFHIDVKILIRLWIAEGFVPLIRNRTHEEIAIRYVEELAQRCMIQVENRARSGRIMVVKVHDILREWGIRKARREGFVKYCQSVEDVESTYSEERVRAYRVVLYGFFGREVGTCIKKLRTVLAFNFSSVKGSIPCHGLHLLRVLHLYDSDEEVHLPEEMGRMKYLWYLGLGGDASWYYLPSSIGSLVSLETLDARGCTIWYIPSSLWKIRALRHVYVSEVWNWSTPQIKSQPKLHVTMRTSQTGIYWRRRKTTSHRLVQRMKEAQHMLSEENNPNFSWCFVADYFSSGTEIIGQCKGGLLFPNDHLDFVDLHISKYEPSMLKICCRNLLGDDQSLIMELGRTQFLCMLEIGNRSYTGRSLRCSSGSFPRLERLVLRDLDVEEWDIEEGSMPQLEELTLCKCSKLSSLPKGLLLLPKLRRVDLIAMPPSCCQEGTVARTLENAGHIVFVSSNEQELKHLPMPEDL